MNLRLCALYATASTLMACGPLETGQHEHPADSFALGPAQVGQHFDAVGWGPVQRTTEPFDRLAFRWDSLEGAEARIDVRMRAEGGSWGAWTEVQVTWRENHAHNGHTNAEGPTPAQEYQLRISGTAPDPIRSLVVEPVVLDEQSAAYDTEELETDNVEVRRLGLAPAHLVNPRETWGARRPACESADRPRRVYIHHTVTPFNDGLEPAARMRQIQAFHMDNRGWCDIGYHYLVSPDGQIWQGRPENRLGAHVANRNSGSTGISFMGDYTHDRPTDTQLRQAGSLVRWLRNQYGVEDTIRGHRDSGQTSCPGDHLYARLNEIAAQSRADEEARPAPEDPPPQPPAPAPNNVRGIYKGVIFAAPDSDRRIPGARVWIEGQNIEMRSSNTGYFAFSLPRGDYTVWAEAPGFARASSRGSVLPSQEVWGSIGLDEAPQPPPEQPAPNNGAQGIYQGVVFVAPDTGRRIPGARVWIEGQNIEMRASDTGYFAFSLPSGDYTLWAEAPGYVPASSRGSVQPHQEVWGSIGLELAASPPDPPPSPEEPHHDPEPSADHTPPRIVVHSPRDGLVVAQDVIRVEGSVEDDRDPIFEVEISGHPVPVVGGSFAADLRLLPGPNRIQLFAVDSSWNLGSAALTVHFLPAEPEPSPHDEVPDNPRDEALDGAEFSGVPKPPEPAAAEPGFQAGPTHRSAGGSPVHSPAAADSPVYSRGSIGCAVAPLDSSSPNPLGKLSALLLLGGLLLRRRPERSAG